MNVRAPAWPHFRCAVQEGPNSEHGIEPRTIVKDIASPLLALSNLDYNDAAFLPPRVGEVDVTDAASLANAIAELEKQMKAAAKRPEFEEAAQLRDRIKELRAQQICNSWVSRSPKWNRWGIGAFYSPPISRLGLGYLPDSPRPCTGVVSPAISRAARG
jgi:hypothetical protein